MNKKWGLVVLAIALIAGSAFAGIRYIENSLVEQVEQFMAATPESNKLSAKSVSYSFFSNVLTIEGARSVTDIGIVRMTSQVERMVVTKPQLDALNPATTGMPLLAEKIALYNIKSTENSEGVNSNSSTEECIIIGWKQNLGAFMAAASKDAPDSEAFWKAALAGSVESITMKNVSTDGEQEGILVTSTMALLTATSPEPRKMSFKLEDCKVKQVLPTGDIVNVSMGSAVFDEIVLPTAPTVALLMNIAIDANNLDQLYGNNSETIDKLWKLLQSDYATASPFTGFTVSNLDIQETPFGGKQGTLAAMETLNMTLQTGSPFSFSLAMKSMRLDPSTVDPVLVEVGLQDATYDFSMGLSMAPQPTPTVIRMSAGSPSLGTGEFSTELILPLNTLSDIFNVDEQVLTDATQIKSASIDYTDKGLLGLSVAVTALEEGVAPATLYYGLMQQANALLPLLTNPATRGLAEQCVAFLEKPGTFKFSIQPVVPINAQALQKLISGQQLETLGITLDIQPGTKSFLETIPAALMQ